MRIHFKSTGKNRWNINVNGQKKGSIKRRRGSFVAQIRRFVDPIVLHHVCKYVAGLNVESHRQRGLAI